MEAEKAAAEVEEPHEAGLVSSPRASVVPHWK
jgi:hypothetical protein